MSTRRLPDESVTLSAMPPITDRESWQRELDHLLRDEKAHTRVGDALAARRRRMPMVKVPSEVAVVGEGGRVPLLDVFEGRRMLVAYFHMWHEGEPWERQCEGCTFCASQMQRPEYLHARDITLAIFCEGDYDESRPYAHFAGYTLPFYSAAAATDLVAGREFGFHACYLRDDQDQVYETYWTTGRGCETQLWSYGLMDLTVYGRQEPWEDSPAGWPRLPAGEHPWRVAGRPVAQWAVTDQVVGTSDEAGCCRTSRE